MGQLVPHLFLPRFLVSLFLLAVQNQIRILLCPEEIFLLIPEWTVLLVFGFSLLNQLFPFCIQLFNRRKLRSLRQSVKRPLCSFVKLQLRTMRFIESSLLCFRQALIFQIHLMGLTVVEDMRIRSVKSARTLSGSLPMMKSIFGRN